MSATTPIRNKEVLENFKNYYLEKGNYRNYLLIVIGLNTALRIGDILPLKWADVYDFSTNRLKSHIELKEQKTSKNSVIALNKAIKKALNDYRDIVSEFSEEDYLFTSRKTEDKPITRVQAYRIIRKAAEETGLNDHIACHSLRKTFGYFAYKSGVNCIMLMEIYNHTSYAVTSRYLGITQDERDAVFEKMVL